MRKEAIVLVLTGVLSLAACRGKSNTTVSSPAQPQQTAEPAQPSSAQAPWKMALTTDPAQPMSEHDVIFRINLTDPSNAPVPGAQAKADLRMRLMDMGKNVVDLSDKGNGVYEGKGQFSMTGPWDVVVTATKDGKSATQTFEITARE